MRAGPGRGAAGAAHSSRPETGLWTIDKIRDDEFDWDDIEAVTNEPDHHVTFEMARAAFGDAFAIARVDYGHDDPEERYARRGMVENRVRFVSYALREERIRIIKAPLTVTLRVMAALGAATAVLRCCEQQRCGRPGQARLDPVMTQKLIAPPRWLSVMAQREGRLDISAEGRTP